MAKAEITKSSEKSVTAPHDIFSAMRDEMDRMFERFEHGWPRWPALFRRNGDFAVLNLDVREDTNSIVVEVELPGVDEKDVSVTLANGMLTIKGREEAREGGEG